MQAAHRSHLSRVCGLKFRSYHPNQYIRVTPFTGVWVEIARISAIMSENVVTPFTGVWVEIGKLSIQADYTNVTPFTGVWVEISKVINSLKTRGHTFHGCVG